MALEQVSGITIPEYNLNELDDRVRNLADYITEQEAGVQFKHIPEDLREVRQLENISTLPVDQNLVSVKPIGAWRPPRITLETFHKYLMPRVHEASEISRPLWVVISRSRLSPYHKDSKLKGDNFLRYGYYPASPIERYVNYLYAYRLPAYLTLATDEHAREPLTDDKQRFTARLSWLKAYALDIFDIGHSHS